jgi:hypothetical protein
MLWLGLLVFFLLAGLTAGVFTNSIRRALTLPMQMSTKNVVAPMQPAKQVTPNVPQQQPTMGAVATQQQMPQNILAQDTFQRTNQNLWGTASDGRQWNGDANAQASSFSVTANHGLIAGPGTFNALLGSSATNIEALLDGSLSHFDGTANLGVVLRYTDTNNWYKALIDGKHLTVLKRANGQTTQLASVAFAAQDAQTYMLRFRVVGVMLFARAWPVGTPEPAAWMITTTDMTFQSGLAGVRVVLQQGLTISITSFAATTASSTV